MSKIESHISDLLMQHNCVVVPRLGAFVGSYQSAVVSHEKGMVYPPYKEILFNKALSHNDGLLIASFAQRYKLTYNEVENIVNEFVNATFLALSRGEVVTVGEIGVLKSDVSGNIFLVQNEGVNFLTHSFGMTALYHEPLRQLRAINTSEGYSRVFVRMLTQKRVTSLAAAALALFLFTTTVDVSDVTHYQSGSVFSVSQVQLPINKTDAPELSEVDVVVTSPSKIQKEIASVVEKRFHLIGASVASKADADKIVDKFIKDGFENATIVEAGGRFRISLNQFETKAGAISSMSELRNNEKYRAVWVFRN